MLSEKIFDAIMTATPRIIDEVVRNIPNRIGFKILPCNQKKRAFCKSKHYALVKAVTSATISSCVGFSKSLAILPSFSITTLPAKDAA